MKLARQTFPDLKDPHTTVLAEAGQAAKLLADHGLAADFALWADGPRPAGDPQVASDAYGTRFLLVAPFGYDGGAGTALSPAAPELTAQLLAPCLESGLISETLTGFEPRELLREYYRLRRRASALVRTADVMAADAADIILHEWGPPANPADRSLYACSPHRIELAAHVIRDAYFTDYANAALRLLPEWTQWCIEQSGIAGDLAARSRAAALTESAALVDEETNAPAAQQTEPPFRRQEA